MDNAKERIKGFAILKYPTFDEEIVQEKIHFLANNLSKQNLEEKVKEIKSLLNSKDFKWFLEHTTIT